MQRRGILRLAAATRTWKLLPAGTCVAVKLDGMFGCGLSSLAAVNLGTGSPAGSGCDAVDMVLLPGGIPRAAAAAA